MNILISFLFIFSMSKSYSCELGEVADLSELENITPIMIEVLKQQMDEVKRPKPPRCPSFGEIKNQKQIVFNFEGTGGYSPKGFFLDQFIARSELKGKWQLKETCKLLKVEKECNEITDDDLNETIIAFPLSRELMIPFHRDEQNTLLYFSHKHMKDSMRCLSGLIDQSKKNGLSLPPIKVMGYSWGGNTAMKFVKELNDKYPNTKIDKVFTVDPVRKGLGVVGNLLGSKNSNYFKKESNTNKHYNIYQKTDKTSMLVGIKGNSVKGVDEEINYVSTTSEHSASYAHIDVPESKAAKSLMQSFMDNSGD